MTSSKLCQPRGPSCPDDSIVLDDVLASDGDGGMLKTRQINRFTMAGYVEIKSKAAAHLLTHVRDQETGPVEFRHYADRILRILAEETLAHLPLEDCTVTAPTGSEVHGKRLPKNVCVVSIMRAGDALANAVTACQPDVAVGKILIRRDEETAQPELFYTNIPASIAKMNVIVVDPMLATGGSASLAIKIVKDAGVSIENILFSCLVAAPEGLGKLQADHPGIKVITASMDDSLNDKCYILPGLGDFGDRYFNSL